MDPFNRLPEGEITPAGDISRKFLQLGTTTFHAACELVHKLPYGYNSDREDRMILFKEGYGSCTTKHAAIAGLALELGLPVVKNIGIYAMTENLVTGTSAILEKYDLPYLPMIHCFLANDRYRVDLTEGNFNGKNGPIDEMLYTATVQHDISAREEYLLYRDALKKEILTRPEFKAVDLKTVLLAREKGLLLLKDSLKAV